MYLFVHRRAGRSLNGVSVLFLTPGLSSNKFVNINFKVNMSMYAPVYHSQEQSSSRRRYTQRIYEYQSQVFSLTLMEAYPSQPL